MERNADVLRRPVLTRRKLIILEYARLCGNVAKACREFEVPRSSFYKWKKAFDAGGKAGLTRKKPIALSHPGKLSPEVVEKILHLRGCVIIVRGQYGLKRT